MCAVLLPFSVRGEENPGYILVMKQVKKLVLPVTYFDYHVDGSNPDFGTRMTNRTTWAQGGSEAYANEANWVDSFLTEDKVPRRHPSLQDPLLDESWYIERIFKPWVSGITDNLLWKTPPLIEPTPRYDSTTGDLVLDTAGNVIYDTVKTEYPDTLIVSDTMFKSIKLEDFDSISWVPNDLTYEDTTDSIWFLGDLGKEDPLGERGFGFENDEIMNSGYTYVLRNKITYNKGDSIVMSGDDDCYLFINGKLALEQGGLHSPSPTTCYLDSLNLTEGEKYNIDFFFAERRTGGHFMLYTNIKFADIEKEFIDTLYDTIIPEGVKHRYYGAFQKGTVHGMCIPEATRDVRIEYFSISGVKLLDIKQPLSTAVKNQNVNLPRGMYTVRATFLNAKGKVIHSAASRKMIVRR
jgi:fibro-slime domain-containing protein